MGLATWGELQAIVVCMCMWVKAATFGTRVYIVHSACAKDGWCALRLRAALSCLRVRGWEEVTARRVPSAGDCPSGATAGRGIELHNAEGAAGRRAVPVVVVEVTSHLRSCIAWLVCHENPRRTTHRDAAPGY